MDIFIIYNFVIFPGSNDKYNLKFLKNVWYTISDDDDEGGCDRVSDNCGQ